VQPPFAPGFWVLPGNKPYKTDNACIAPHASHKAR
jgi:hypothetical protein